MSDLRESGVLYTEHCQLTSRLPIVPSLWSFETRARELDRPSVRRTREGSHEYWLERSDPLLNTILPGTGVSLVLNFADLWAAGRSLATAALLPRIFVVGPVTQARILRVGRAVRAVGAGFPSPLTPHILGVPASELVDRIVPLEDLWPADDVERLVTCSSLEIPRAVSALQDELLARAGRMTSPETIGRTASQFIRIHGGRVSIDDLARDHGLSRQHFVRRFAAAAGLPPKLFARITRFQALVQALLSTDVSGWASMSSAVGFYDQAHMINEFHTLAGSPPTVFFRPHGTDINQANVQLRGRPSEWLCRP